MRLNPTQQKNYIDFLAGNTVVNLKDEQEFVCISTFLLSVHLESVLRLSRFGFEQLHRNGGANAIPLGDLCVEFKLSDEGTFTIGSKEEYLDAGYNVVCIREFCGF